MKNPSDLPQFSPAACNEFKAPSVRVVSISFVLYSTERSQERENLPHGVGFVGGQLQSGKIEEAVRIEQAQFAFRFGRESPTGINHDEAHGFKRCVLALQNG